MSKNSQSIQDYLGEDKYPSAIKFTYGFGLDFKEIVKCFQSSGIMSEKLLKYLDVTSV